MYIFARIVIGSLMLHNNTLVSKFIEIIRWVDLIEKTVEV